jgi:collagenase-like PrtC family protease
MVQQVGRKAPELVIPAGITTASIRAAVDHGADAVYVGVRRERRADRLRNDLGFRGEIACFTPEQLAPMVELCRAHRVELMVALNNLYTESQREQALATAGEMERLGVRTLIVADPAFMAALARELPGMKLHVSLVGSTGNRLTAELYRRMGACRVVLENHLPLEDVAQIRRRAGIEVEIFLFGITCLSFHRFCLLSAYAHGVTCVTPCNRSAEISGLDAPRGRVLRPRDLDLLALIPQFADAGVDALKVEGRMRSPFFVAAITEAARHVLDAWREGRDTAVPERMGRRVSRLPFFGTTRGYFGPHPPEQGSLAFEGGSAWNKAVEMAHNPRLAAYLARRTLLGAGKLPPLPIECDPAMPSRAQGTTGPAAAAAPSARPKIVLETGILSPMVVKAADRIYVGEKHCALRFVEHAGRLPGLLDRIRESGREAGLTIPGPIPEGLVDSVLAVVRSLRDRVAAANCYDYGMAAQLGGEMEVTVTTLVNGTGDARELVSRLGVRSLRPLYLPLRRYAAGGFPEVPIEMLVFGHMVVSPGVFCLTRAFSTCPESGCGWFPVRHKLMDLAIDGNTLYSARACSAHLLRDHLQALPLAALVVDGMHQTAERVEAVIRFWRGEGEWPEVPESELCNAMYAGDLGEWTYQPIPWQDYRRDLAALVFPGR